jgi:hypothetical protein
MGAREALAKAARNVQATLLIQEVRDWRDGRLSDEKLVEAVRGSIAAVNEILEKVKK